MMSLYERLIDFRDEKLAADFFADSSVVFFKEAAAAGLCFDDAETFELGVGFGDGVAIDAKFLRKRSNGRQRFAGSKSTGSGGGFDLIHYLEVDGFAGFEVDLKEHVVLLS